MKKSVKFLIIITIVFLFLTILVNACSAHAVYFIAQEPYSYEDDDITITLRETKTWLRCDSMDNSFGATFYLRSDVKPDYVKVKEIVFNVEDLGLYVQKDLNEFSSFYEKNSKDGSTFYRAAFFETFTTVEELLNQWNKNTKDDLVSARHLFKKFKQVKQSEISLTLEISIEDVVTFREYKFKFLTENYVFPSFISQILGCLH